MLNSLRARLTAWYLLFFAALLAAFCVFLYALLARNLYRNLDSVLLGDANTAVNLFEAELAETKGDTAAAAAETFEAMRGEGTLISIFEGSRLLAASDPRAARGLAGEGLRTAVARSRSGAYRLIAAAPVSSITSQLNELVRLFLIALPIAILIAGTGGYLLAGWSLRPVVTLSKQTARITEKNLDERLEAKGAAAELALLAGSFNELLSRLEQSFETMRRFVADASHELRTPLSVIRGEADVALARPREPEEYRESLEAVRDEARRLSRLVDDLLNLARADAGRRPLNLEEFYLNELVEECCRSLRPLAAHKGIELRCSAAADVPFRGDQELLRRLVLNLADNAIRYTPAGGAVAVAVEAAADRVRIVVSDTGIGIPPESAPHVFERFYRVDAARSRSQGGFGLGLPIAKWIAESHRGTLELSQTSEKGSVFSVSLPVHPAFM